MTIYIYMNMKHISFFPEFCNAQIPKHLFIMPWAKQYC